MLLKNQAVISLCDVLHDEGFEAQLLNLDVATLSWAMRDRPTWDQHRVPPRAKHNWFKACSELTFHCNPPRAEEEVLCFERCSTRLLPAVRWRFFLPSQADKSSLLFVNSFIWLSLHCSCSDGLVLDLIGEQALCLTPPLWASSALLDNSASTSSSSSLKSEMPLVCERWQVSESKVSRSNISSSNTQWDTQTPEHDCWIENGLRWRYEWGACISLNMSAATIACLSDFFFPFFLLLLVLKNVQTKKSQHRHCPHE